MTGAEKALKQRALETFLQVRLVLVVAIWNDFIDYQVFPSFGIAFACTVIVNLFILI